MTQPRIRPPLYRIAAALALLLLASASTALRTERAPGARSLPHLVRAPAGEENLLPLKPRAEQDIGAAQSLLPPPTPETAINFSVYFPSPRAAGPLATAEISVLHLRGPPAAVHL